MVNKLFGSSFTVGSEVEFFYNRIQIFVAIVLGLLTAVTQYLRYKNTNKKTFGKKILFPAVVSLVISAAVSVFGDIDYDKFGAGYLAAIHLGLFASIFAVVANTGSLGPVPGG